MKTTLLILSFTLAIFNGIGQIKQDDLLGSWMASDLQHFDSRNSIDQEATDHFWEMLEGRIITYRTGGLADVSGYETCFWYVEDDSLFMRYSETGKWEKEAIVLLDDTSLIVRGEVDFPEDDNVQVTTYTRISE